jgi:hypothetical protein
VLQFKIRNEAENIDEGAAGGFAPLAVIRTAEQADPDENNKKGRG